MPSGGETTPSGGETTMSADELLKALARAAGERALLWRGDEPTGKDLDLLVHEDVAGPVSAVLSAAGLRLQPMADMCTVWSDLSGRLTPIDVLAAGRWAPYYPTLDSVSSRPSELERLARDGRLPYGEAARLAARSPMARAALRARVAERARAVLRGEARLPRPGDVLCDRRGHTCGAGTAGRLPRPGRPGRILALSGMDSSGKSTLADTVLEHLESAGQPVELAWMRVTSEGHVLERVATPMKRLLRREGSIAEKTARTDVTILDARRPPDAVAHEAIALVDGMR